MRSFIFLSGLLSVVAAINGVHAAVTAVQATKFEVVESLSHVPQGWHQIAGRPGPAQLQFRIAVKQEHAFAFENHVVAISTPGHPKYGQHMSRDQLKAMLRPPPAATNAILRWLSDYGIPKKDIQEKGDWIAFRTTIGRAQLMLHTNFHYYADATGRNKVIRTLHYSVPQKLHQYIHMIQPTVRFDRVQPSLSQHFLTGSARDAVAHRYHGSGLNSTFCNSTITPQCLKDLYGLAGYKGKAAEGMHVQLFSDNWIADILLFQTEMLTVFSQHHRNWRLFE